MRHKEKKKKKERGLINKNARFGVVFSLDFCFFFAHYFFTFLSLICVFEERERESVLVLLPLRKSLFCPLLKSPMTTTFDEEGKEDEGSETRRSSSVPKAKVNINATLFRWTKWIVEKSSLIPDGKNVFRR